MTCRCSDLRLALLALVRANRIHADSELNERFLTIEPGAPWPEETESAKALRRAMRRARVLLRETKKS
jgi:hypothetical protein